MLALAIEQARNDRITQEIYDALKREHPSSYEILKVRMFSRSDLFLLMRFCDIRIIEGVPVIAATDDEMRMAYMAWRGDGVKQRKKEWKRATQFLKNRTDEFRAFITLGGVL